jgi:signal transduction histidine kinase
MQARLKRYVEDRLAMIGAISHDLRTPLARIRFKIEGAPPALRAAVAADLDQMEAMITAAVAFVHDTTHLPEREQLDLLSVLECVVDDARSAGGEAHLSASERLIVEGDALALNRLFANLVDNAIKYAAPAPSGADAPPPTLQILAGTDGDHVVLTVVDAGPGIPERDRAHAVERFVRLEQSRSLPGSGLGLSLVSAVAHLHHGELRLADNAPGLKATIILPRAGPPGSDAITSGTG